MREGGKGWEEVALAGRENSWVSNKSCVPGTPASFSVSGIEH